MNLKSFFFKKSQEVTAKPTITGKNIHSSTILPAHAKILRSVNDKMMRMYEAAVSNNLNADFPVSITSSNSEILTSIANARSRARTLERDNPYARAIIESLQNNVGGEEPFRLEMKVGKYDDKGKFHAERKTNQLIEDWWKEAGYPENCTVRRDMSRLEMDLQAIASIVRDGGQLFRHHTGFPNNPYRYAIEPIEIDRLDHYYNRPKRGDDAEIQFSIELDDFKGAVAYWILTRHPGDTFVSWGGSPRYRERVPADQMIALFDLRSRAEQFVGMPRFASIIQRLHRIDQFDIAHVTAAIWASCKPFFITQDFPTAMETVPDFIKSAIETAMDGSSNDGDKFSSVEPGTGEVLPYGQKPVLVDPKFPIEAASSFKKDNLRAAASGSGAPYHVIGNDLESVNFSSARIGLEAFHDTCKILQRHYILNVRRPHFNKALESALLSGELELPITRLKELQRAACFYGRRWAYINPQQDAQADVIRLENGLTSRSRIIAESDRGGDAEQVDAENASDRESAESHGLAYGEAAKTEPKTEDDKDDDDEKEKKDETDAHFLNPRPNGKITPFTSSRP